MYVDQKKKKKINFDVDKNRFKELSNDYVHTCFNFQTVGFGEKVMEIVNLLYKAA